MKVKDLLKEIKICKKDWPDFLEWEVYTEQLGVDKDTDMMKKFGNSYEKITDGENWTYVKTMEPGAWCTKMPKEKIFTINVNY